ncbi:MAG: choice-of-anchor D domain-containing protein, partial [Bacteroidetes bacterium]
MKKILCLLFVFVLAGCFQKSYSQSVEAGYYFSNILCSSGTPKGTGYNWNGQLGIGQYSSEVNPVAASGLSGIMSISGGEYHTLVLKSDSTVWAYGDNGNGQLGDGTYNATTTAVQVSGLTGIKAISAGGQFSLALKSNGTVWAWGNNGDGQLGDGTYNTSNVPVQVSGLTGITAIGAGYYHALAVKSPGTVWAWGANWNGMLGDGTYGGSNIPVQAIGLTGMTAVAGGYEHSLALKSDGTVWGFGYNGYGQLGDGTYNTTNLAVQSIITGVSQIAAGSYFSLAVKSTGTAWSWGANWNGALGDGTTNDNEFPSQISGLSTIVSISGGYEHSCAVESDGTFWAWGDNGDGQLGDGSYDDSYVPLLLRDCCTGSPDIALSDTCVIDTTEIGGSSQYFFYIRNSACGILNVTNITSNNAAFTATPSAVSVQAFDSTMITVTYSPTILGNNLGTLTIFNNANDTTMCLAGYCLQAPLITYSPASFSVTLGCNTASTSTLTIGNTGLGILDFDIAIEASGTGASFYEGFESGNIATWTNEGGAYTKQVITAAPANGTYDFQLIGGSNGWLDGISHSFAASQPSYISFKIKSEGGNMGASNDVMIGQASDISGSGPIGYFWVDNNSSTVNMYTGWSGTLSYPVDYNTWHKIEFRNINYSTHKFDYYVDGSLMMLNISFENSNINSLDVVHLFSYDFNTSYFDEIIFGEDPNGWLSANPTYSTVASFGSTNLNVNFNSNNFPVGVYYGNVSVYSNDPATPQVVVPCTLTVTGDPEIDVQVTGCPAFNTIMVGATHQQNFQIDNIGCDTLHISNATSSSGEFIVNSFPTAIPPFGTSTITITFQPTVVGSHTTTIDVSNDDNGSETFCLQGVANPAPTLSVTPTSFNMTAACSQTVTNTLTISNPGAANLTYTVSGSGSTPIAACGANTGSNCCNYGIMNVQFNTINNASANATVGYQNFTSINTVIQKSVPYLLTVQTGYANDYVNAWIDWNNNGIFEGSDLVMNNMNGVLNHTVSVTSPANAVLSAPLRMRIVSSFYSGPPSCGTTTYGQHEDYTVFVLKWLTAGPPLTGTVTPTGSVNIPVTFNAAGLTVGTYTSSITVSSNDPLNPTIQIPCSFTVTGTPDIDIAVTGCPSFNTTLVGNVDKDTFIVSNLGCDTLNITSVTSTVSHFVINSYTTMIPPFSTGKLIIWFQPTIAGSYTTTIDVFNNDANTSFCLQGVAIPPPTIVVSPASYSVSLGCNSVSTSTLTISNTGSSDLYWNGLVNGSGGGGSGTPPTGYCYPGMSSGNGYSYVNRVTTTGGLTNITTIVDAGFTGNAGIGVNYFNTVSASELTGGTFTVTVQAAGSGNNSHFSIWIDWNRNAAFDAGELMVNSVACANNLTNFAINVPVNATTGATRMRIINWGANTLFGPCDVSSYYGECEDFLFYVAQLGVTIAPTTGTVTPTGSQTVLVTFNSQFLLTGVYS